MPVAEPTDPLYLAAKQVYDGWPKDSEDTAWQLGLAWAQTGEKIAATGTKLGRIGQGVTAAWTDPAGSAAAGKVTQHAQQVGQIPAELQGVAAIVNGYATALMNTKNAITQTVQENSGLYAALPFPFLQTVFAAKVAADIRSTVEKQASELQKIKVQGLNADGSLSFAKDGKEFSVKGEANLEKATGVFDGTNGSWDLTTGAHAGAGAGVNNKKGLYAQIEGGADVNGSLGYHDKLGDVGYGAKASGSYGLNGVGGVQAGPQGVGAKGEVMLGGKISGRVEGSYAGITVGGTLEGSAGIGAKGQFGVFEDESGKWHAGLGANLTPIVGGGGSVDVTVDPSQVAKSFEESEKAVGEWFAGDGGR
ncbi:hypothetical protein GCM10022222_80180 [Amycolatopsis ultiminotia]|uniref:Outer membrane channel protein CpnT-like N-terminal domain-containing protein n=1 Tax=Amycolatopsis ultiminotia TaxID=543629 RepID=A0ABP6YI62_9PSEU